MEKAQNLAIYNKVAEHARRAFARLVIRPGVYTPADIMKEKKQGAAFYTGDPDEVAIVTVNAFTCSFSVARALDLLAKLANAYHIPTAARVTFERTEKQAEELRAILDAEAEARRIQEEVERIAEERRQEEARRARIIEEGEELNARTMAGEFATRHAIIIELPTTTGTTEPTPEPRAEVLAPAGTIEPEAITQPESVPTTDTRALVATIARRALYVAALFVAVLLLAITPDRTQPTSAHNSKPAPARTNKYICLEPDTQSAPEAITEPTAPELPEVVITPSHHAKRAHRAAKRAPEAIADPTEPTAAADTLNAEPVAITTTATEPQPEALDAITPEAEPEAITEPEATSDDDQNTEPTEPTEPESDPQPAPAPGSGSTAPTTTPATLAPVLVAAGVPAVVIPYIIAAF